MSHVPAPPQDPSPPGKLERFARATLKTLLDLGKGAVRQPLTAVLAITLGGGAATATQIDGPARWITLGALGVAGLASLLILWHAAAAKRAAELEADVAALANELEERRAAEQRLIELGREQAEALDRHEERERRDAIYAEHLKGVIRGFAGALNEGWAVGNEFVHLVESTSLSATAELFAGQLGRGAKVRVELGLAEPSEHGYRVTHASGPYTRELKTSGECYTKVLAPVLARKAEAHFIKDGWHLIEMEDGRSLICFTEVLLSASEKSALGEQAAIIELITVAFRELA